MTRSELKHRLAAPPVLVAVTSGCGLESVTIGGSSDPQPTVAPTGTADATSGLGSVKDAGDLPDPCTLLSETEVAALTGQKITHLDEDGVDAGGSARYCQWQQSGALPALFLSRTTRRTSR